MIFNRRQFMKTGLLGLGAVGMTAMPVPAKTHFKRVSPGKAAPIGTARNLIFVFLEGGASHVDTFDLKRGRWTPDTLGVQQIGNLDWPSGIMPNLATLTDKFSIVRSISAAEAAHSRAVYHLISAHRQNPDLIRDIPHFASMLAYKFAAERNPTHTMPSFVLIGDSPAENGFLPIQNAPLKLGENGSIQDLRHEWEGKEDRFSLLQSLRKGTYNDPRDDYQKQQAEANRIMHDPGVLSFFGANYEEEENENEGEEGGAFVAACQNAVKVLEANLGTRIMQLQLGGWDHHDNIYQDQALFGLSRSLDKGVSYLITELEKKPGVNGGSLLDETLIVVAGEFGRTVGNLNTSAGRDHHHYVLPALFAGGGVKGGRLIGSTDAVGEFIRDQGWSRNREMQPEDLIATIYSALGVDWTERFTNTPSGRLFEMVETTRVGEVHHIDQLFV